MIGRAAASAGSAAEPAGGTADDSSDPAGAGAGSGGWITLPSSAEGGATLTARRVHPGRRAPGATGDYWVTYSV